MGHTNRSVQKFTRWAQAAATTWPEMGMGSAGPGHRWNWAGLTDSSYSNSTGSFLHSNSTEVQKTHSLQMYRHHFRSKMCWNVSATSWKGFGGNPWAKPRWRAEERLQQQPAPQNLQGMPDSLAAAKGQHPCTVPEDCRALPRQAQKAISHSWTIQKQILRLKRTLAIVRQGQGPRRRKKKIYSLDTKLVLWQHGKTLFNLLKWYTWSNSSEVPTFPGTEPKHYLLVTLGQQDWKQRVPMEWHLCPQLHTELWAGAPETPRRTTVPGHPTAQTAKASSSTAKWQNSCSSEGFPEIGELTVLSSVPSTVSCCSRSKAR